MTTVLSKPWQIELFRMRAQEKALILEIKGMRCSAGRSLYAVVKEEYRLDGTRNKVLAQFQSLIEKKEQEYGLQPRSTSLP
jgi:hypothetical protein